MTLTNLRSKILTYIRNNPRVVAFILCFWVLFLRSKQRYLHATLWGEDAPIFLEQALGQGWSSLFIQYAGYFHTIPRVLALPISLLPFSAFPKAIYLTCIAITSFVFSMFASPRYGHIVSSTILRIMFCVTLCQGPGMFEILGNLANIHWILTVYLLFTAIRPMENALTKVELFFSILCVFSAGECIVLLPLFLYRAYLEQRDRGAIRICASDLVLAFLILFGALLNFSQRQHNPVKVPIQWSNFGDGAIHTIGNQLVFEPWLGSDLTNWWTQLLSEGSFMTLTLISIVMVLAVTFQLISNRSTSSLALFGAISLFGLPILTWIARPDSLDYFKWQNHDVYFWNVRYSFQLWPSALLIWMIVLSQKQIKFTIGRRNIYINFAVCFFLISYFLHTESSTRKIRQYGSEDSWNDAVPYLESSRRTGCPRIVTVPTYPNGWGFTYRSDVVSPCLWHRE